MSTPRSFCDNVLTSGICHNRHSCSSRHVLTKYDRPLEHIPRNGTVKFHIIKIKSPTHFTVRLLEHKPVNRKKYEKIKSDYIFFYMEFKSYFKDQANHVIHHPPNLGDICVIDVEHGDHDYRRCRIIEVHTTK